MNKIKILIVCMMATLVFGVEEAPRNMNDNHIILHKDFVESSKVKPRFLFANIRIASSSLLRNSGELSDENRMAITKILNEVIQLSKRDDICKGGSYYIEPLESYENNIRRTIGQHVNFSLECKFSEQDGLSKYNALLASINQMLLKDKLLVLPQPSISHQITPDEIRTEKERLFGVFLAKLDKVASEYSQLLSKQCHVQKVSLQDDSSIAPMPRMMSSKAALNATLEDSSTHTKAPISIDVDVYIRPKVEFACR